ncbi:hypothetical protein DJICPGNB_02600 [Escherichia coli]|nr:hypothetical protein DJICPGNB_02600 [Escherichia coli]
MTGSGIIFQFAVYRNFFAALLNNMQHQRRNSACGNTKCCPGRSRIRSSISSAALRPNASNKICSGDASPRTSNQPARATSTDVFPLPAPASTNRECSPLTTARACAGFSGEDSTWRKKSRHSGKPAAGSIRTDSCCDGAQYLSTQTQTITPRLTAVIEFFQSVNRQRQRRQSLADLLLNARGLFTRQPFIFSSARGNQIQLLA